MQLEISAIAQLMRDIHCETFKREEAGQVHRAVLDQVLHEPRYKSSAPEQPEPSDTTNRRPRQKKPANSEPSS